MIFAKQDNFRLSITLNEIQKKLDSKKFVKTHRSFIVNLEHIEEIIPWFNNTYMLKIRGKNIQIPVSRSNVKRFKEIMGII